MAVHGLVVSSQTIPCILQLGATPPQTTVCTSQDLPEDVEAKCERNRLQAPLATPCGVEPPLSLMINSYRRQEISYGHKMQQQFKVLLRA